MGPRLFAARYNVSRSLLLEFFESPAEIGVRCALPGWLQRLEVTVKTRSKFDAYERYRSHLGHGFTIFDSYLDKPITDGWVYEVVPDGRHVHYICAGGWKRLTDQYEEDNPATIGNPTTDAYLKTVLQNHAPAVSTNYSNIVATGTATGLAFRVWEDPGTPGTLPQDIVETILQMSTASNEVLDFWLESQRLNNVALRPPIAYMQPRKSNVTVDWQVERKDIVEVTLGRHIWDLGNEVEVYFTLNTTLNGNHSKGDTVIAVVSSANFGVGQEIEIELDDDNTHRTAIAAIAGNNITINDALPDDAATASRVWKRKPLQDTGAVSNTDSKSAYWTRHRRETVRDMNTTPAHQYRDTLLDELSEPQQQASFTVGSKYVLNNVGAKQPLWRMLQRPGYLRVNDLFPAAAFSSRDGLRSFYVVALDYNHSTRRMTITPDAFLGDNRLDVLLQRAGFAVGQMIQRS